MDQLAVGGLGGPAPDPVGDLSPREEEILAFIAQGLTNAEIARNLYLSINSVKTYVRTAYRKIGVTRRSQAVAWGIQHGLAPGSGRDVAAGASAHG